MCNQKDINDVQNWINTNLGSNFVIKDKEQYQTTVQVQTEYQKRYEQKLNEFLNQNQELLTNQKQTKPSSKKSSTSKVFHAAKQSESNLSDSSNSSNSIKQNKPKKQKTYNQNNKPIENVAVLLDEILKLNEITNQFFIDITSSNDESASSKKLKKFKKKLSSKQYQERSKRLQDKVNYYKSNQDLPATIETQNIKELHTKEQTSTVENKFNNEESDSSESGTDNQMPNYIRKCYAQNNNRKKVRHDYYQQE